MLKRARLAGSYRARATLGRWTVHLVLLGLSLFALIPFVMLLSASFSSEEALGKYGYPLFPREFSLSAYQFLLADSEQLLNSYFITISVTLLGGAGGLLIM